MAKQTLPVTQLMASIESGDADTAHSTVSDSESSKTTVKAGIYEMSRLSQAYDLNGDGVLDAAERAMKDMDTTGRGYLTNEKVYQLMNEHLEMQKSLFRFKKVVIGLAVFVALLTLSNLGTSFAAAYLAKDTATNDTVLVDAKSNEAVSTQTTADNFDYTRAYDGTEGRRLCSKENGAYTCTTASWLKIPLDEGVRMIEKCKKGKTVDLRRTWHDKSETVVPICPTTKGTFSEIESRFGNGIVMTLSDDGKFYELAGDQLTQNLADACDANVDCGTGLTCKDNLQAIDACKRRCDRLRFGPQRLQGCYDGCDFRSCQASTTEG